jgi:hypothetical protein
MSDKCNSYELSDGIGLDLCNLERGTCVNIRNVRSGQSRIGPQMYCRSCGENPQIVY